MTSEGTFLPTFSGERCEATTTVRPALVVPGREREGEDAAEGGAVSEKVSTNVSAMLKKGPTLPTERAILTMEKQARAHVSVRSDLMCPGAIVLTKNGSQEVSAKIFAVRPTLNDVEDIAIAATRVGGRGGGGAVGEGEDDAVCHNTLENAVRGGAMACDREVMFYSALRLYRDPKYGPDRVWKLLSGCFFVTRKSRLDSLQHLCAFLRLYQARSVFVDRGRDKTLLWNAIDFVCAPSNLHTSRRFVRGCVDVLSGPPPQGHGEEGHPAFRNREMRRIYLQAFESSMTDETPHAEAVTYLEARYVIPVSISHASSCIGAFVACGGTDTLDRTSLASRAGLSMDLESASSGESRAEDTTWTERVLAARVLETEHMKHVDRLREEVEDAKTTARASADHTFPLRLIERTSRPHTFNERSLARLSTYQNTLEMLGQVLLFSTLVHSRTSSSSSVTDDEEEEEEEEEEEDTELSNLKKKLSPSNQIEDANYALATACILAADVTDIRCRIVYHPSLNSSSVGPGTSFRAAGESGKKRTVVASEYELFSTLTTRGRYGSGGPENLSVRGGFGADRDTDDEAANAASGLHAPFIRSRHVGEVMRMLFKRLSFHKLIRQILQPSEIIDLEMVLNHVSMTVDNNSSLFWKWSSDAGRICDMPLLCALAAVANVGVTNPMAVGAVLTTCEAYFSGLLQDRADMAAALFWCSGFVKDPADVTTCPHTMTFFNTSHELFSKKMMDSKGRGENADLMSSRLECEAVFQFFENDVECSDASFPKTPPWAKGAVFSRAFRERMNAEVFQNPKIGIEHDQTARIILESVLLSNRDTMCVDALLVVNPEAHAAKGRGEEQQQRRRPAGDGGGRSDVRVDPLDPVAAFGIRASIGTCIMACMQTHADYPVVLACGSLRCMIKMWQRGSMKGAQTSEIASEFDFGRRFVCGPAASAFKGNFLPEPYCRPAMVLPRLRIAKFSRSSQLAGSLSSSRGGSAKGLRAAPAASAPNSPVFGTSSDSRKRSALGLHIREERSASVMQVPRSSSAKRSRPSARRQPEHVMERIDEDEDTRELFFSQSKNRKVVEFKAIYRSIISRLIEPVCLSGKDIRGSVHKFRTQGDRKVMGLQYTFKGVDVIPEALDDVLGSYFISVSRNERTTNVSIVIFKDSSENRQVMAACVLSCICSESENERVVREAKQTKSPAPLYIEDKLNVFVPPHHVVSREATGYSPEKKVDMFRNACESLSEVLGWNSTTEMKAFLVESRSYVDV